MKFIGFFPFFQIILLLLMLVLFNSNYTKFTESNYNAKSNLRCSNTNIWHIDYKYNPTSVYDMSPEETELQAGAVLSYTTCQSGILSFTIKGFIGNGSYPIVSVNVNAQRIFTKDISKPEKVHLSLNTGDTVSISFLNQYYKGNEKRVVRITPPSWTRE